MVKVIKEKNKKRCTCEFCKTLLEYTRDDVEKYILDNLNRIKCPSCQKLTRCEDK